MSVRNAMMMVSFALAATAVCAPGEAAAQGATVAERQAIRAEVPWYEQFTSSTGPTQNLGGLGPTTERGVSAWAPSSRWGVTVDLRDAETQVRRAPSVGETSVGAFYQFTPRMRVGGQVSLAPSRSGAAPLRTDEEEPNAGVRLESAFRF